MRASEMTAESPRPPSATPPPSATSAPRPRPPSAREPRASPGRPARATPSLVTPETTSGVPDAASASDRATPDDTGAPAAPLPVATTDRPVATTLSRAARPAPAVRPAPAPTPAPAADARAVRPEDDVLLDEELRFSEEDLDDSDADAPPPPRALPAAFADRPAPPETQTPAAFRRARALLDPVPDPDSYDDDDASPDGLLAASSPPRATTPPTSAPGDEPEPEPAPRWDPSGSPTPTPSSRRRSRRRRRVPSEDASSSSSGSRRYFTSEGLAGVQVRVEVANVEVDERACGEDSDEEAEAVVAAVRRWQDPWRRRAPAADAAVDSADSAAPRPRTYSTTEAHPLHPMRGVPADATGADFDGPDASSLGWMWTMDPLPATLEVDFDPETASRLAAEIADAVLDEEIDAALARAEEALARTEEARERVGVGVAREEAREGASVEDSAEGLRAEVRDSAEGFVAAVLDAASSPDAAKEKDKEKDEKDEVAVGTSPGAASGVLAAAAERSVSSPAANARRFPPRSGVSRGDVRRGELPRIVPPAPPPDLTAAASAPGGPAGGRGVAALARRSKVRGRDASTRLTDRDASSPTRALSPLRGFAAASHPLGVGYRGFAPGESSAAASSSSSSSLFAGGDPFSSRADRESRLVTALRGELRSARDERLELESRCQSLQLRSTVAEWERDQLKVRLEELETAWDQHRRALRREVTTRVKVGLDYADDHRGGRTGDDRDEGDEADGVDRRSPALFPQEVLQAVVRGAVDQSVECALGASAAGRSSSYGEGGFDDARRRAPRYVSEGTNAYPGPTGLDGDELDADPAVSEDAAEVYGMVRDALRVG